MAEPSTHKKKKPPTKKRTCLPAGHNLPLTHFSLTHHSSDTQFTICNTFRAPIMLRFLLLSSLTLLCSVNHTAASYWSGKFEDTTFGGSLFVCVSEVTEADTTVSTIGQGMLSKFGYLRGQIRGDEWTGNYYLAGIEARHGTFSLSLAGDGLSYSGLFSESVGYSYAMGGNKLSTVVPKDTDCFKTDASLLTQSARLTLYSYTSNAIATNIARYVYHLSSYRLCKYILFIYYTLHSSIQQCHPRQSCLQ